MDWLHAALPSTVIKLETVTSATAILVIPFATMDTHIDLLALLEHLATAELINDVILLALLLVDLLLTHPLLNNSAKLDSDCSMTKDTSVTLKDLDSINVLETVYVPTKLLLNLLFSLAPKELNALALTPTRNAAVWLLLPLASTLRIENPLLLPFLPLLLPLLLLLLLLETLALVESDGIASEETKHFLSAMEHAELTISACGRLERLLLRMDDAVLTDHALVFNLAMSTMTALLVNSVPSTIAAISTILTLEYAFKPVTNSVSAMFLNKCVV